MALIDCPFLPQDMGSVPPRLQHCENTALQSEMTRRKPKRTNLAPFLLQGWYPRTQNYNQCSHQCSNIVHITFHLWQPKILVQSLYWQLYFSVLTISDGYFLTHYLYVLLEHHIERSLFLKHSKQEKRSVQPCFAVLISHIRNPPNCKPLIIDYIMYAQKLFSCNAQYIVHTYIIFILKWYYDQKIISFFSSDFERVFA